MSACGCNHFKSQFQLRYFGFTVFSEELSWVNQFGDPSVFTSRVAFFIWRIFLVSVMIAGMAIEIVHDFDEKNSAWFLMYLTNWALVVHIAHLLSASLVVLWIIYKPPDESSVQPSFTKIVWCLRSISQPGAFIITIAFWALVFNGNITLSVLWVHAINSIVVVCDIFTSRYQTRLIHYVYILAFGSGFVIWSVIHYFANVGDGFSDHKYIYKVLDWSPGHVGMAVTTCVLVLFVLSPICMFMVWALTGLRDVLKPSPGTEISSDQADVKNPSAPHLSLDGDQTPPSV